MQTSDLGVLFLALLIIAAALFQEGTWDMELQWVIEDDPSSYKNGYVASPSELLPLPLITDIDGDGLNEVVIATRKPSIQILRMNTATSTYVHENSSPYTIMNEADLLSSTVRVASGRQPIAIKSGYIQPYDKSGARKQVIVVITDGFHVFCFDSTLTLLWERVVDIDMGDSFLNEVSILIDSHALLESDNGLVVVGGRLMSKTDFHVDAADESEESEESEDDDLVNFQRQERNTMLGGERASENGGHFSFFAFDGLTGSVRWAHQAVDHEMDNYDTSAELVQPQHGTRAAINAMARTRDTNEQDWRNFRQDMLASLPHSWTFRDDTTFTLSHFARKRQGQDSKTVEEYSLRHNKWLSSLYEAKMPHSDQEHVTNPNCFVVHSRTGLEVMHLYTGHTLCTLSLRAALAHADVNNDGIVDHIEAVSGARMPYKTIANRPGAPPCLGLVSSGAVSSEYLFKGAICGVEHFDMLNQNNGEDDSDLRKIKLATPATLKLTGTKMSSKSLYQSIFFASNGVLTSFFPDGGLSWAIETKASWSFTPEEYRWYGFSNRRGRRKRFRRTPLKPMEPQNKLALSFLERAFLPSITPLSLFAETWFDSEAEKQNVIVDHILAVGQHHVSLISEKGEILVEVAVNNVPISKPVFGDFSNDGINDVILLTSGGYNMFVVERSLGATFFTVIAGVLVVLLGFVFIIKASFASKTHSG